MHTIVLHYGGTFGMETPILYMGGKSKQFDDVDPEKFSMADLRNWIQGLGFTEKVNVCYVSPTCVLGDELRMVCSYSDMVVMFAEYKDIDAIHLYLEYEIEFDVLKDIEIGFERYKGKQTFVDEDGEMSTHNEGLAEDSDLSESSSENIETNASLHDELIHHSDCDSEMNDTPLNSDEERDNVNPIFDEVEDMKNPKLRLGMIFKDAATFRKALREHSIKKGYNFEFLKNEGDRVTVKCVDECPFRVHASKMQGSRTFQIKSLIEHCIHPRRYELKSVTSTWLANKYLNKLIDDPKWDVNAIRKTVRREQSVFVSKKQVYRAKSKALEAIEGNHKEDFTRIRDYCGMILKTNPGSVACVTVERSWPGCAPFFQRVFVQYAAQIKGFKAGCRPVIGLDACHLKGPYGGQMMHAVARDGNKKMFPLAMAVVEAENKDSWTWFLNLLGDVIGRPEEMGWIYISDRQKGLTQSFKNIMPGAEHRYCMRHLYANFKNVYKGDDLKNLVWGAAYAYTKEEFKKHMDDLKTLNVDAYHWLMKEHPSTWARSHFSTNAKCNLVSNNISESFNNWINEARDKPIITMMEHIRHQMMSRFQEQKDDLRKFYSDICPNVMKKIEKAKFKSTSCEVRLAGNWIFEICLELRTFIVDLHKRQCSCRKFDLTGIPCIHACAAIMYDKRKVEDFVHKYYWKQTYINVWEDMIYPIPDKQEWIEAEGEKLQPPMMRIAPGRPKKSRVRAPDEPRASGAISKVGRRMTCSNCNEFGHNKLSCKNPPKPKRKKTSDNAVESSRPNNSINPTGNTNTSEGRFGARGGANGGRFSARGGTNGGRFGARGGRKTRITGHGNPIGPNGETFTGAHISRRTTVRKSNKTTVIQKDVAENSSGVVLGAIGGNQRSSGVVLGAVGGSQNSSDVVLGTVGGSQSSSGVGFGPVGGNQCSIGRIHPKVIKKSTRFGDILFSQGPIDKPV
ncbi:PREDICTED: uncharacterized protein LOC105961430 [Erythranthe guttata]|uniref:uncharacterized protein LOC105961430 n=1 Tax=Erythranthe guttata TaxID=4155 RepID=UPI00064E0ADA|nr:PREDICTED: uncharacterized protein LOC105961430 [Erythranthe guttata]|eukprot:XP_012841115.1 PREDICTED: uncharacterized protein LOC105961430 [Erythranthe guttata]